MNSSVLANIIRIHMKLETTKKEGIGKAFNALIMESNIADLVSIANELIKEFGIDNDVLQFIYFCEKQQFYSKKNEKCDSLSPKSENFVNFKKLNKNEMMDDIRNKMKMLNKRGVCVCICKIFKHLSKYKMLKVFLSLLLKYKLYLTCQLLSHLLMVIDSYNEKQHSKKTKKRLQAIKNNKNNKNMENCEKESQRENDKEKEKVLCILGDRLPFDIFVYINNCLTIEDTFSLSKCNRNFYIMIENQYFWEQYSYNVILCLNIKKMNIIMENKCQLYCYNVNKTGMELYINQEYCYVLDCLKCEIKDCASKNLKARTGRRRSRRQRNRIDNNNVRFGRLTFLNDNSMDLSDGNADKADTSSNSNDDFESKLEIECDTNDNDNSMKTKGNPCVLAKFFGHICNENFKDFYESFRKILFNMQTLEICDYWECVFDHLPFEWIFEILGRKDGLCIYPLRLIRAMNRCDLSVKIFDNFCENYHKFCQNSYSKSDLRIRTCHEIWYKYSIENLYQRLSKLDSNFNTLYMRMNDSHHKITKCNCETISELNEIFHYNIHKVHMSFGNNQGHGMFTNDDLNQIFLSSNVFETNGSSSNNIWKTLLTDEILNKLSLPQTCYLILCSTAYFQRKNDTLLFEALNVLLKHEYLMRILNWPNSVNSINLEMRIRGLDSIIDLSNTHNSKIKALATDNFQSVRNVLTTLLNNFEILQALTLDLHIIYSKNMNECIDIIRLFFDIIVSFVMYYGKSKLTKIHLKFCFWNTVKHKKHFGNIKHHINHDSLKKSINDGNKSEMIDSMFDNLIQHITDNIEKQNLKTKSKFKDYTIYCQQNILFDSRL